MANIVKIMQPRIYCDTNTLAPNIRKSPQEFQALKQLRAFSQEGKCTLLRSHIVRGEIERTKNDAIREQLEADYKLLENILYDEKLLGINTVYDQFGGFTSSPLISDIQDQKLFEEIHQEIMRRRVSGPAIVRTSRDAEHLAQAISNGCDYFLTRDQKTIIRPMRKWLEQRYPPIKIRKPSELVAEIGDS